MIMRTYDYYLYQDVDSYGQPSLSTTPIGKIKISINTTNQSIQDNINYKSANYIGLTMAPIDDKYVIQYGNEKLKVLYVEPNTRFTQVFLAKI